VTDDFSIEIEVSNSQSLAYGGNSTVPGMDSAAPSLIPIRIDLTEVMEHKTQRESMEVDQPMDLLPVDGDSPPTDDAQREPSVHDEDKSDIARPSYESGTLKVKVEATAEASGDQKPRRSGRRSSASSLPPSVVSDDPSSQLSNDDDASQPSRKRKRSLTTEVEVSAPAGDKLGDYSAYSIRNMCPSVKSYVAYEYLQLHWWVPSGNLTHRSPKKR
jgi:hypothetical protein